jgi:hypothetical protein
MADAEILSEIQRRFVRLVGDLIAWTYSQPRLSLTFGEAYRTPEQAALDAQKGSGIARSLHLERLAVDLNLFVDGLYQERTEDYRPLGEYWESLGGAWGGRFTRADGNHFSLAYEGRQ